MMEMTKEKAIESRKTYCEVNKGSNDAISEEKMMNDATATEDSPQKLNRTV